MPSLHRLLLAGPCGVLVALTGCTQVGADNGGQAPAPAQAPDGPLACDHLGEVVPLGGIRFGQRGNECNYYECRDNGAGPVMYGTAVGCSRDGGPIEPGPSPPYVCDPRLLEVDSFTPPNGPCPLGTLHVMTEFGPYGPCVPTAQCAPLPCDPARGDAWCPVDLVCDAASRVCVVPS